MNNGEVRKEVVLSSVSVLDLKGMEGGAVKPLNACTLSHRPCGNFLMERDYK